MPITTVRPSPAVLPPLEALVLQDTDLRGFRRLFADVDRSTNDAVAARAQNPERRRRCLQEWGRVDGYAVRFVPEAGRTPVGRQTPIVIDSSVSRFERGAGALQALNDETSFPDTPAASRLFPRNIADNTESVYELFEEDGVQFALYRVDFRVGNIVGSVGAVWRRPHGGPLEALTLAERQAERIRTALQATARERASFEHKER
jgi:hypothetical protein